MKILIIGPEVRDRADCHDFGSVWSFYLTREFRRRGLEVVFDKGKGDVAHYARLDLSGVKHALAVGRFFQRQPPECAWVLAERLPGLLCQISDRVRSKDPVDVTFTVLNDNRRATGINVHAGWAADKEICAPRQDPELRILIDHPNYGPGYRVDHSALIVHQCAQFKLDGNWRGAYPGLLVRRIEDGAVRPVDLDLPSVPEFNRVHIPFEKVAEEYSKCHVFLVTHPESAGMSVLETAFCGALPVVPKGFIAPELLATVRHVEYEGSIPWDTVLRSIDIKASRNVALKNSWMRVANRLLCYLENEA